MATLTVPEWVELPEQHVMAIGAQVPMSEYGAFYQRALGQLFSYIGQHQIEVVGAPMSVMHGIPPESTFYAAVPVAHPMVADGDIEPQVLPAGRAATLTVTGAYDRIAPAYERLASWIGEQGVIPGAIAWEQYLNEPAGDGSGNITQLYWVPAG